MLLGRHWTLLRRPDIYTVPACRAGESRYSHRVPPVLHSERCLCCMQSPRRTLSTVQVRRGMHDSIWEARQCPAVSHHSTARWTRPTQEGAEGDGRRLLVMCRARHQEGTQHYVRILQFAIAPQDGARGLIPAGVGSRGACRVGRGDVPGGADKIQGPGHPATSWTKGQASGHGTCGAPCPQHPSNTGNHETRHMSTCIFILTL